MAQESRLLLHAEKLAAAKQQEIRKTLAPLLESVRLYTSRGDYVAARAQGDKILAIDPAWPDALYEQFWTLSELGNRARRYETLSAATALYQSAHDLARRLADGTEPHPHAQRDLSVSYNKRGDVLLQTGQVQEALDSYQQALDIRLQLAEADPKDAQAQRDLMVSHYKLGEVQVTLEQWDAAIAAFERGVAVLDGMIAQRMSVEASAKEKAILEQRIEFCREQMKQK